MVEWQHPKHPKREAPLDPLERTEHELYRAGEFELKEQRHALSSHEERAGEAWGTSLRTTLMPVRRNTTSVAWKMLTASIVFFTVALLAAGFIFLREENVVSSKNVDIAIVGPVSISAGDELQFQVVINNRNSVSLETPEIIIRYPEGARDSHNVEKELKDVRDGLDDIGVNTLIKVPARVILFGQEGDQKNIKIELEYRMKDSNAIFVAEKEYPMYISASPVRVEARLLDETIAGQEVELSVALDSNAKDILRDILVSVDYPFGFTFKDATPAPAYGTSVWNFGDIPAGGKHTLKIRGILEGQDGERKVFRITAGTRDRKDEQKVGIAYATLAEETAITKPFLSVDAKVNGKSENDVVVPSEGDIEVTLAWANNLATKLTDVEIEMRIDGNAIDKKSVSPWKGFYDSTENVVRWDKRTLEGFDVLEPGAVGSTNISFSPKPSSSGSFVLKNPHITLQITARGKRLSERNVPETIERTITRLIKVESKLALSQNTVYSTGPFLNTGPIPPQAETPTSYTILWSLTNASNELSGGVVRGVLPPAVRYLGATAPLSEKILYDAKNRIVEWNIGRLAPGVGTVSAPREVAFQIELTASLSQVQQEPVLITDTEFQGTDTYSNSSVSATALDATTKISTDPIYDFGKERVVGPK